MKTALLITTDDKFREIPFEDKLEFYYKHLECDMIEITDPRALRKIGSLSNKFIMVVDEEALLKNNPKLNIYASAFRGMSLYGNVMIIKQGFKGLTRKDHEELALAINKLLKLLEQKYSGTRDHDE